MVVRVDLGEANAGQIVLLGTIDTVDLAALRAKILSHLHTIGGVCSTVSENPVPIRSEFGKTTFLTDWLGDGADPAWEGGNCGNRSHSHGAGTLAVSNTIATTILTPTNNDLITVAFANGDIVCDLIDGYAPEVVYDRYDGHYHWIGGIVAIHAHARLTGQGTSGRAYFRMATDAAGTDPQWKIIQSDPAASNQHDHANFNLALLAYTAPAAAGVDGAGEPKFSADFATGNIATKGDVNNIGISEFKTDYDGHNAHAWTGQTATRAEDTSLLYNGSHRYAAVSGGWERPFAIGAEHFHTGPPLTVATPT